MNTLGNYNPIFYSQETLAWLRANLGFGNRVHRALEAERNSTGMQQGDIVRTKRPRTFTAQDHVAGTGTTAQDLKTQNVQVTLDQHKEVKFTISDKELAFSQDRIINDHIGPAANALIRSVDQTLYSLASKVGPKVDIESNLATVAKHYTLPQQVLFENNVPVDDIANMHYLVDGYQRQRFQEAEIFHKADTTGQGQNSTLFSGTLGTRFGTQTFASQLAGQAVAGYTSSVTDGGDTAGAIDGGGSPVDVNSETITVDALTDTQTLQVGDTFQVAGDPTIYTVQNAATVASNAVTLNIYPGLQQEAADNAVVTFISQTASQAAGAHYENLMFHRDAFGLIMAPLPEVGNGRGAEIATVSDPDTGLSVRSRLFYNGDTATLSVALDILFGVQVMNGQMACRVIRATQ